MLHGTVWDTPSASSKKEVSFKPETELEYVTSNCMEGAVRQFEKEASLRLGTGVEYVAYGTVWEAPSASSKKKLVLDQQREKYFLTDTL